MLRSVRYVSTALRRTSTYAECRAYVTGVVYSTIEPLTSSFHCNDSIIPHRTLLAQRLSTAAEGSRQEHNVTDEVKQPTPADAADVIDATDELTAKEIGESVRIFQNFITEEEEKSLFDEVEPHLKRMRYQTSHWDDAIYGYRETERKQWTQKNKVILDRLRSLAFPPGTPQLAFVHVLDVEAKGAIKSHVDSTRFCGSTISGICLLSSAVMRFTHEKDKSRYADALLKRRSLYIMQGKARYDYAHAVLGAEESKFRGQVVPRDRRISVICRNEPVPEDS